MKDGDKVETRLTTKEVAKLYNKDERTIQRWAKSGKLEAECVYNEFNSPAYLFAISVLDKPIQEKYFAQVKASLPKAAKSTGKKDKPFDHYTDSERQEIMWWEKTLKEWGNYRDRYPGDKAEADDKFVALYAKTDPEHTFSVKTLYRKKKQMETQGLEALIDKRGKGRQGASSIADVVWDVFQSFYLDEAQHPIQKCYEYTLRYFQKMAPELVADIPTYSTFWRRIQRDIPEPMEVLGRQGQKAFRDRCTPYIRRTYEAMASNEWWVADNHTFDVITQGENGQLHRLYLTAFFDARSGFYTGWHVTTAPSSQSTLIALRKGILKYGIPENIYVDNGREFLTHDIGGLGHRKKKPKDGEERFEVPPVFERLGIKMTNAIVKNAKAKIIERRFRDVKDQLSRLFETYTGGNVVEKPEKLKGVLKNGEIPLDATFTDTVDTLLDGYFNQQPYGGEVTADHGKPRQQVYNENLHTKRVAGAEDLNLMLMRSARVQKVTRRGVHLDIAGQRLDYWNDDFIFNYMGEKVYFRYDPDDLSAVRVYDLEDRFIMEVPVDNTAVLTYGASKEEVKQAMGKVRRLERITKEALEASTVQAFGRRTALELVLEQAHENQTARIIPEPRPKVLELQRPNEEPLLKAVGGPDLDVMNRNAMKRNGGFDNE